jgi:hypothetical protein
MTYTPTTWADEVPATSPVKYNIKTSGGTPIYTDVQIEVNTSVTPGTPLNAVNLNHIETGIQTLENASPPKVFTAKGDLFVGSAAGVGVVKPVGANYEQLIANSGQPGGVNWYNGIPGMFTAKGDLCAATAADAAARVAVGSNHDHLIADSTWSSTGLRWVNQITAQYTRLAAPQSLTDDTLTKVSFDTVEFDPHSCLSSGKFTAPMAGMYQINASVMVCQNPAQANVVTKVLIAIYINGTIWANTMFVQRDTQASHPGISANISMLKDMAATNYVEIYIKASNGNTGWFVSNQNSPKATWLDVFLVRA